VIHRRIPDIRYCSINWNYLPPAGASILHPHFQVVADRTPTQLQGKLIRESASYYEKSRSNYWHDLIHTEVKMEDRYLYHNDHIAVFTSFAPQGNNEVLGILPEVSSILEMEEHSFDTLSKVISKVLKGYYNMGIESFNMSVFPGPIDQKNNFYSLSFKINSRPRLRTYYINDCGFMERLHLESIIETKPEDVATTLKNYVK
jgi:galactose-1-phosphate uridylyltransferase